MISGVRYRHELLKERHNGSRRDVTALCRDLGISRMTYYEVINGKTGVSLQMLERIARSLDLSLSAVLILDDRESEAAAV